MTYGRRHARRPLIPPALAAGLLALMVCGHAQRAQAWDPIRSAGHSLAGGVRSELEPMLASTIADVDKRSSALATRVIAQANDAAAERLDQTNNILATRLEQTDNILEKQILHLRIESQAVIKGGLDQVDDISRQRLVEAGKLLKDTVHDLDGTVKSALADADGILKARTHDLSVTVNQSLDHADEVLSDRIRQIDEAAGRRLANVDVIATKQRYGIEATLVRTAVLIGLVVFFVFVVIRLWGDYKKAGEVKPLGEAGVGGEGTTAPAALTRLRHFGAIATGLGTPLALRIVGAGAVAGLFAILYTELPLGAAAASNALVARHVELLEDSLARLAYADVRFHASQLELLMPAGASRYRALAAKADLLERVLARPTTLATPQGIRDAMDKAAEVERLLGDEQDADVLVVKALMLWQVGSLRSDEHEAASLCARAVRVARGRFALQPLAVNLLTSFLHAPYLPPGALLGRDAEALPELEQALRAAGVERPGFPLARAIELDGLIRTVDREVTRAYLAMIEAHADMRRVRTGSREPSPAWQAARERRQRRAQEVLAAWKAFDASVQAVPGLAGSPEVLALFRLNDATWARAAWFVTNPDTEAIAPLLERLSNRDGDIALKIALMPPRVAWARRYAALLAGPARSLVELQEAHRYHANEARLAELEEGIATVVTAPRPPEDWRKVARGAAALGLFVDDGTGPRRPYALQLLGRAAGGAPGAPAGASAGPPAPAGPPDLAAALDGDSDLESALESRTLWLSART